MLTVFNRQEIKIYNAEPSAMSLTDLDSEKLMPLLQIALALAFAALAAIGFLLIGSRRQQHMRALRSNNRRVEEAQIVREWEELQQRLRDRSMEQEAVDNRNAPY
jgi:flagellar biosynthesis/type III secretory pathway M-ring protein FliF/YscJ